MVATRTIKQTRPQRFLSGSTLLQRRPILATSNAVRHILGDLINHIAEMRPKILIDAQSLVSKRETTEITTMFIR